jgi:large subunit ribosomal protein L7/L12
MSKLLFLTMCLASLSIACSRPEPQESASADNFDVILTEIGDQKIQIIKAVREITGLGLKDAKDLVESAPATVKPGIAKEEADRAARTLEEAGGTIEIRPHGG